MGEKSPFDVAVVGAGPSGSQCARLLAERGYRVILLEKHSQPRTHIICTGIIGREGFFRFIPVKAGQGGEDERKIDGFPFC